MAVLRPDLIIKCSIPVVMAGIIAIVRNYSSWLFSPVACLLPLSRGWRVIGPTTFRAPADTHPDTNHRRSTVSSSRS